jgi:hypothetical protein
MNSKKLNGMEMNQNQKSTGKGYSEAIQDKEKKLVATMKRLDMHFYILCVSLVLFSFM